MKANAIIPFGKYKGQPIEVLSQDPQYLDWVTSQDWFKSRYPQLNTIIINNFNQPNDTPEHNGLVALFMDDKFVYKFVKSYTDGNVDLDKIITDVDICTSIYWLTINCDRSEDRKNFIYNEIKKGYNITTEHDTKFIFDRGFELKNGSDIGISYELTKEIDISFKDLKLPEGHYYNKGIHKHKKEIKGINNLKAFAIEGNVQIECKPIISDDYPSIIRQCRSQGSNCLVTYQYTGTGATLNQVRDMFPDIKIILVNEIQNTDI